MLVACAPDIFYAEDSDGDGKADFREVLFTGFSEGNQQHRFNGFELGLDGWVYGANGDSGGRVRSLKTGKSTPINGRDFRFRPDTGEFEAESGQTQYGRHRDDWGHWFGNNNPNWAWHYVLADHDLRRNPAYAPPDPRQTLEPDTRVFPLSRTLARFNDPTCRRPRHLGQQCDALSRRAVRALVRLEPFRQRAGAQPGASDRARARGRDASAAIAGRTSRIASSWRRATTGSGRRCSRPGPTGHSGLPTCTALSSSIRSGFPTTGKSGSILRAGSEQGRIYRVYPVDKKPRTIPRLDKLDTTGLVAALESPSGWQRDTAQRLLLHRRDPHAIGPLRKLVRETKNAQDCASRRSGRWLILEGLTSRSFLAGLEDPDPRVRESVIATASTLGEPVSASARSA